MGKDPDERLYGPQLVFEEKSFKCGYAPRILLVSTRHRNTIFVGSKDGSVTILRPDKEETPSAGFPSFGDFKEAKSLDGPSGALKGESAIRALCEWDDNHLLLARSDGSLEVACWRPGGGPEEPAPPSISNPFTDPVRYLHRLDESHIAVAYRKTGLTVIEQKSGSSLIPWKVGSEPIQGIRAIFPFRCGTKGDGESLWILLTDRGRLYQWDKISAEDPRPVDGLWSARQPSLISDFCLLRSEKERVEGEAASEALLATDRGLYLLFSERVDTRWELRLRRVALSGLSGTPMVLSYTSCACSGGEQREYLWVTDLRGDSHLFWGKGSRPEGERKFWRSGVHHSQSETLSCALLPDVSDAGEGEERRDAPFFVVQVRHDDRIVLGRYWNPEYSDLSQQAVEPRKDLTLRELLSFGIYQGESGAQAIRSYLQDEEWKEEEMAESWWLQNDAAIIAELFEFLAEDEDRRRVLLESLRAPYADAAKKILGSLDDHGSVKYPYASQLWRLALLGILHRAPGDQTPSYVGLLRWLRHRQVELPDGKEFENLSRQLDNDLLLAQKWGLRAGMNRSREDLILPQKIFEAQAEKETKQHGATKEQERLLWERLTYRAELFGRSVNLIHENAEGRLRGRTAWATSVLRHGEQTLIAVSWIWGGVEIFTLENHDPSPTLKFQGGDYGADAEDIGQHVLAGTRRQQSQIKREKYGYSRIVHLGTIEGNAYLLSAPASEPPAMGDSKAGRCANLYLWLLKDLGKEDIEPRKIPLTEVGSESIYSLLDLEEGRLVAGLRGEGPEAFLALIQLKVQDSILDAKPPIVIPVSIGPAPAAPQGEDKTGTGTRSRGRNRMWSLAKIAGPSENRYRVAFGCDSGEIHEVTIDWNGEPSVEPGPHLIGRMGSPVRALACRQLAGGLTRVFAGGEDGAIVAWQEISRSTPQNHERPRFGTLWATVEKGAISQIHLLDAGEEPAVLAVTREGRYVTFNDRLGINPPLHPGRPSRVPLPGSRHGRRTLHCAAFASSLIEDQQTLGSYWTDAKDLGAFAVLLIASDDGRLRLVSLHNPEATRQRKEEYTEIVKLWRQVLTNPIHFRLTEAAYKSSPSLSLIVVRYLLDQEDDNHDLPMRKELEEAPWSLPRHLRPLFRLRLLWDKLRSGQSHPQDYEKLESLLSAALGRAWKLNDLNLFQEICQVVLRKANEDLYMAVASPEGNLPASSQPGETTRMSKEVASRTFLSVLTAIEHSLPWWRSSSEQREARARIVVAKHLADGDTARMLLREAAREKEPQEKREPCPGTAESEPRHGPFQLVLNERIRSIRELVNKRNPLVSLESLRAANLSLARMCHTLVRNREAIAAESDGMYEPLKAGTRLEDYEVKWEVFHDYSDELISAAVRAFRTPLELNDALAHEFSRTFALFICACPSATMRIESLLTERLRVSDSKLEEGIFARILAQLEVLRTIGIGAPIWADELVRLGTHPPKRGWDWVEEGEDAGLPTLSQFGVFSYIRDYAHQGSDPQSMNAEKAARKELEGSLGLENATNLANIRRVYSILRRLHDLVEKLETTAEGIDLSKKWRDELLATAQSLEGDHSHSRAFFKNVFERVDFFSLARREDLRKVRPETVRLSQSLAKWAEESLAEIDHRARTGRLFQPEVTTFARVFRRLERAASNFPTSAAVQTNVVQGILGHHLLEDMDEHALELEEIAEVLNPRKVWEFRDRGRKGPSEPSVDVSSNGKKPTKPPLGRPRATAEDFAVYLLDRARSAETIPKSLRMLQALLGTTKKSKKRPWKDLLEPFQWVDDRRDDEFAWKVSGAEGKEARDLEPIEARYLALVLAELDQNQRKHAWPGGWDKEKRRPECHFSADGLVRFRFWFALEDIDLDSDAPDPVDPENNFGRLHHAAAEDGLEGPAVPRHTGSVASSGTGFYLANLAAAIVSWKLRLEKPDKDRGARIGSFWIELRNEGEQRRKGGTHE